MESAERAIERVAQQWSACIDSLSSGGCPINKATSQRFSNPAAYHIDSASSKVATYVLVGGEAPEVMKELGDIAKIMALREGPASDSLKSFQVLRDAVIREEMFANMSFDNQEDVMGRLGECLFHTLDEYVRSREKILQISIDELKRRNKMLETIQDESFMVTREVRS